MLAGTREEMLSLITNSGFTLCDLASNFGCSPEEMAKYLNQLSVPLPSMSIEGPYDFIKGLRKGITNSYSAKDLLSDPTGGFQHLPRGARGEFVPNMQLIYQAVHGPHFVDPYTGKEVTEQGLMFVDGNDENLLVTNIEAIGEDTWRERFAHPVGPVHEVFKFTTKWFEIEIEVARKYDQLIGGAYVPEYIHQLFCTWVGYPLNMFLNRNPEDEVIFPNKNPTVIAWWIWAQLSNYALLKGLKTVKVTSLDVKSLENFSNNSKSNIATTTMQHSALLSDFEVMYALHSLVVTSQAFVAREMEDEKANSNHESTSTLS